MVGVDQIDVLVGMIVFLVVLLLAGFAAWAYMRMGDSETRSMRGYHHTIETLEDIGHRTPAGAVRVLRDPNATEGEPGEGDRWVGGTGPATPTSGAGATAAGVVAKDAGAGNSYAFEDTSVRGRLNAPPGPKVQARALTAMNRRPRRLGGPIAVAVIVLAVLAGVIAIGASGNHHSGQPPATTVATTSTTAAPAGHHSSTTVATTSTTTAPAGHQSSTTVPAGKKKSATARSTTTTVPTKFLAVSSTATTATYVPPANGYQITFTTAAGECWVNVASTSGATLLSQTLPIGVSKVVAATGQTTVIIGAPRAVTISVDHEPVVLPAGYQTPFTITFRPA